MLELRTADDAMVANYQAAPAEAEATATEEPAEEGTAEPTEEAAEEPAAEANIVGVPWQWTKTESSDDSTLTVDDPSKYTMTLEEDGSVTLQADCNQGSGTYTLPGPQQITVELTVMTLVACPEGSLADTFMQQLGSSRTFVMDGDDLVLNMFADAGNMHFSPAQ